jgi:hypothetical protein
MRLDDHEKILSSIERNRHWPQALEGLAASVTDLEDEVDEKAEELRLAHQRLDLRKMRLREGIGYSPDSRKAARDLGLSADTP